jgi:hypothetical protein
VRVLIDWDDQYPALYLRFGGYGTEGETEVPDDVAERWRATWDAWWELADEVRAFEAERGVTQ